MKAQKLPPVDWLREYLDYHPESGELRWRKGNNRKVKVGDLVGKVNTTGYRCTKIGGKYYLLHRICWALHYGEDPHPLPVDHMDGDKLNNRINNLRTVTYTENSLNRKLLTTNTSGHRGVTMIRGKWRARGTLHGRITDLGSYDCKEDAITARLNFERENNIFVRTD
jgi:hypothetical protein